MATTTMIKATAITSTKRGQDPLLFHAPLRFRMDDGWKDDWVGGMGWMKCLGTFCLG